jgi:hypothetical protein
MIKFDEYEDVNARIKRFRTAHAVGRIETDIVECDLDKGYILVRARVYREHEDLVPAAVDYAFGHQAFYRENMKRWYVEDTTTSAIGRAISLLMPVEARPTKQNMDQIENGPIVDVWATITPAPESGAIAIGSAVDALRMQLGGEITESTPLCSHGRMLWKEGISSKTGNKYKGWVCPNKDKPQCPPQWIKD